jgi:hypothetical protein
VDLISVTWILKCGSIACALISLGTGLAAAQRWYQSSKIKADPRWGLPGLTSYSEPVDPDQSNRDLILATLKGLDTAGGLNAVAARWTAASVCASAVSAMLGAFV